MKAPYEAGKRRKKEPLAKVTDREDSNWSKQGGVVGRYIQQVKGI